MGTQFKVVDASGVVYSALLLKSVDEVLVNEKDFEAFVEELYDFMPTDDWEGSESGISWPSPEDDEWVYCSSGHYIVKSLNDELRAVSPEQFAADYTKI